MCLWGGLSLLFTHKSLINDSVWAHKSLSVLLRCIYGKLGFACKSRCLGHIIDNCCINTSSKLLNMLINLLHIYLLLLQINISGTLFVHIFECIHCLWIFQGDHPFVQHLVLCSLHCHRSLVCSFSLINDIYNLDKHFVGDQRFFF